MENTQTEIPLSKPKLIKLLVFSLVFLIAGLWIAIANPQTSNSVFNAPIFKAVAGYGGILMGVLGIYFFGRKLFDKNPGLIVNEQGIQDNTSAFKFGLIPWSDIAAIHERSMQASIASKQHFVTIVLKNPEEYIARESKGIRKWLLQMNAKNYGSPIHISTNGLQTNHKALLQLLTSRFEQHKRTAKLDQL